MERGAGGEPSSLLLLGVSLNLFGLSLSLLCGRRRRWITVLDSSTEERV